MPPLETLHTLQALPLFAMFPMGSRFVIDHYSFNIFVWDSIQREGTWNLLPHVKFRSIKPQILVALTVSGTNQSGFWNSATTSTLWLAPAGEIWSSWNKMWWKLLGLSGVYSSPAIVYPTTFLHWNCLIPLFEANVPALTGYQASLNTCVEHHC